MKLENKHSYNKGGYVVIAELPADQQDTFRRWIVEGGHGRPVMEQEGERAMDCAWVQDYECWYACLPMSGHQRPQPEKCVVS